jgi:anti-sigma-K factor RskA
LNIKEYISSGILESYALGELSQSERVEVERNLVQYPELRKELALIEETMEAFLMKAGKTPKASVKEKVFASIGRTPKVIKLEVLSAWKYATAASIVIALSATILAYNFWNNWKETEVSLTELRALNEQVARDYNQVNQRLDAIENEMKIMSNPAFERVIMNGTANAPEALASVYWNQNTQEVYLSIQNLKTLAQEQQYQLWAIVDGKPVDMGVFDGPAGGTALSGLVKMKNVGKAAAFAVTIEPRGGKPSPSLETMQVLGNT